MKKSTTAALLAGTAIALGLRSRAGKKSRNRCESEAQRVIDHAAQRYMMYFGLPAWSIAGGLDWLWHRQTKIETTSGPKESIMHLLMMAESGAGVLAGLFLEPNAGMFAIMSGGMLLHQATVVYDVEYTAPRRKIPVREQLTHTFMETLPFDILTVFACMYPDQFRSMLGLGPEKPDFTLRFRKPTLRVRHIGAIFGAATVISALPHIEELWRCWRAYREGLTGTETPECARELYAA